MFRIMLGRVKTVEHDALIADHAAATVQGGRVHALRIHARLGAGDEERRGLMRRVQTLEVQVAAIHHIERACFHGHNVQHIDIMQLAVTDMD